MTFKRFFTLFLAGLLCLTTTACKRPNEHFISAGALTDEQFYSAPDLIVKATVINLKQEYFTDPDGEGLKNAHVSVYKLEVTEVYKGSLWNELPQEIPVKLYNGKGLTEKQYKKLKNRFALEVGQEYILGISDLRTKDAEEQYNDAGGYVIEDEYLWTFALNENGLYENMDRGANHRTFDLITLKEKITELYHYEPENEPVVPRYTVDESIKDPAITAEQREQFFEFVQKWRVDAMYEFTPEKPMELELFKYYCAYFMEDDETTYVDMGVTYPGAAIERIAKWFGTTYGLKDDEKVFLKACSLRDFPLAELIQYKEETVDGKTLVTARCILYDFPEYRYVDWSDVPKMESYAGYKRMILDGYVSSGYEFYSIFDFSFYTEDGKTPTQFVSYDDYSPEFFDEGFPLPEFIPAKTENNETPDPAPTPRETVTFTKEAKLERIGDGVFYYGIESFYPGLEGNENAELRDVLKTNSLAGYEVFKKAEKDSENKLCEMYGYDSSGHNDPYADIYHYPDYHVAKINGIAGTYYLICPPKTNFYELYNTMILMNTHKDSVIVRSTKGPYEIVPSVYYYEIQRFMPTINGKQVNFETLAKDDPRAVEKLLAQAERDTTQKLCEKVTRDDGSLEYRYKGHVIFKIHTLNSNTEDPNDYHEALVVGLSGMDCTTVFDIIFNGLRFI